MQSRLTRARHDRMIAGVCGGLGHYFGVDPVIVRLIFVVVAITTFLTPILYPILWLIMPAEEPGRPSMPLPPDARFDPLTGEPLPPRGAEGQSAGGGAAHFHQPDTGGSGPTPAPGNRHRTLGFLLLGVGAIVLLNTVDEALSQLFGVDLSGVIFPVLLVLAGVYLLRRNQV